ncbi:cell wall hydrolase [Pseudomonas yamanorum]|uniref:cell wall hydrolase n=1 Tax=Pseudomonas yamanorum TaxID=515393 RepID=UPI000B82DEF1|nr:cell wall hydrolase [Pseudomonas yamanorum]
MPATSALLCLALNIYHEARGEPKQGQIAVGMVTMNRALWDSDAVCEVVYAPDQFSWTRTLRNSQLKEPYAWQNARRVARAILEGEYSDNTQGATHFHTPSVSPAWRNELQRTQKIGNHIFYTSS